MSGYFAEAVLGNVNWSSVLFSAGWMEGIGNMIPTWMRAVKWIDLYGLGIIALFIGFFFLMRTVFPKVGAIAWVTAKEALLQPLFLILLLVGLFGLFIFLFLPYHTLGEDIKLVVSQGLTLIKLFCVFLAIWTASTSISEEIDGKTALMILAKPVSRRLFVIGKYLGVMVAVTALFLILALFFVNTVSYKLVYDARESAKDIPTAVQCLLYVRAVLPGLALYYLETIILAAISVALSTRLSLLPNLTICLTIYAIGHIMPLLVGSPIAENYQLVGFVAHLTSAVLPVLDHFNMETAVAMNRDVPIGYVLNSGLYAGLYALLALVVSLLLFEDRDLA